LKAAVKMLETMGETGPKNIRSVVVDGRLAPQNSMQSTEWRTTRNLDV